MPNPFAAKEWMDFDPGTGLGDPSTPLTAESIKELERRLANYAAVELAAGDSALAASLAGALARIAALEAGVPAVTHPDLNTLSLDFTSDAHLSSAIAWAGTTVRNADGQLVGTPLGGSERSWRRWGPYRVPTGETRRAWMTVDTAPVGVTVYTSVSLRHDDNNYVAVSVGNGALHVRIVQGSDASDLTVDATWDDTAQRGVGVEYDETADEFQVVTTDDGSTFTPVGDAIPGWAGFVASVVYVQVEFGYWGTEESAPPVIAIGSLNDWDAAPGGGGGGGPGGGTGSVLFDGKADNGKLGNWAVEHAFGASTSVTVVDGSSLLSGHQAFRFQSQTAAATDGPRAELAAWNPDQRFTEGMEVYVGDAIRGQATSGWLSGNATVMQFKNEGTGSPPLRLHIAYWGPGDANNGLMAITQQASNLWPLLVPMANIATAKYIVQRIVFSSDASVGEYQVWVDDVEVVETRNVATLYAGLYSYLKQGLYGEQSNWVEWLGAKVGTSYNSVDAASR